MSWQDELSALDADVAAGRISAEDYRARRDELLARSGSGSGAADNPFPPAFRWGLGAEGSAQRFQVVRGAPPADSDRTQVVRGAPPADPDHTQVVRRAPTPDPDHTQVVRPAATPSPAGVPGGASTPPWQQQGAPGARATGPFRGAAARGPDTFDEFRTSSRRNKQLVPILAVVAAVLVVAGITGFALSTGDAAVLVAGSATTTEEPRAIAVPPGDTQLDGEFPTFDQLTEAGVLAPEELAALAPGEPTATDVVVTTEGDTTQGVWAFTMGGAPASALQGIADLYDGAGFTASETSVAGVQSYRLDPPEGQPGDTTLRGLYLADDALVRVEAYGTDAATVEAAFSALLATQVELVKPTS